jgi:hypothetical protein
MRCIYYLSPTLKSTHQISDDLHDVGVDDWFLHIHSKDESGWSKSTCIPAIIWKPWTLFAKA